MSKDKEDSDFYRIWQPGPNGWPMLDQMATYKANRHLSTGDYKLESLSKEDLGTTKVIGVDPGSKPFSWAVLLLDEEGNIIQPKINIYGPSGPPGWIPSDAFPPGFPFWDIPTTLILTDPRLKLRLQMLLACEVLGINYDLTPMVKLFNGAGKTYADRWSRGIDFEYWAT